jgi:UDP-N-acetylglucosamine 2-epimerase (non-hydrolysing)
MTRAKILFVVGARPNFMKVAPLIAAAGRWNARPCPDVTFQSVLVHTGQHYDEKLSGAILRQLGMPDPDEHLGVGSGSHAVQTARLLESLEPVVERHRPDAVVVPGDVNSTCAAALVAAKLHVPVVHLEAGLRSGDRAMPEEVNRIVADHLSDLLLTTCADGDANLLREGIPSERIVDVGNTMIDSLVRLRPAAEATFAATRERLALGAGPLVLVTLHRPSNVDEPAQLRRLMGVLGELADEVEVVFPAHPRTRARLEASGGPSVAVRAGLHLSEPLGYLEFLGLMTRAAAVLTDSGGIQEETTFLGVPCVTARTTTERPITVALGTNTLVDPSDATAILGAVRDVLTGGIVTPPPVVPLWDGRAGERAVEALARWHAGVPAAAPAWTC